MLQIIISDLFISDMSTKVAKYPKIIRKSKQ